MSEFLEKTSLGSFISELSPKQFASLLISLVHEKPQLFFSLYLSAPQNLLPNLSQETYFTSLLKNQVNRLNDIEFNEWFFDRNLINFYDIFEIRSLCLKRPDNKNLNSHLKIIDKPTNTEQLIDSLFYYRVKDLSIYQDLIQEHQKTLQALNQRGFNKNSKIMSTLFYRLDKFQNFDDKMKVCQEIGLEPFKILYNSSAHLNLNMSSLSVEQIEHIWNQIPNTNLIKKFSAFSRVFTFQSYENGYLNLVYDCLKTQSDEKYLEKASLCFKYAMQCHFASNQDKIIDIYKNIVQNIDTIIKDNYCCKDLPLITGNGLFIKSFSFDKLKKFEQEFMLCILNPLYHQLQKNIPHLSDSSRKIKI